MFWPVEFFISTGQLKSTITFYRPGLKNYQQNRKLEREDGRWIKKEREREGVSNITMQTSRKLDTVYKGSKREESRRVIALVSLSTHTSGDTPQGVLHIN